MLNYSNRNFYIPLLGSVIDNRPNLVGISARTLLVIIRVGSGCNGGVSMLIYLSILFRYMDFLQNKI